MLDQSRPETQEIVVAPPDQPDLLWQERHTRDLNAA